MKKCLFVVMQLLVMMGVVLVSCGEGEELEQPPVETPESPEDNLPEAARTFVGYWSNQGQKGGDFIFFGDGTCWMTAIGDCARSDVGYWTYDTSTKILATTTGSWQWQVTLSNSEVWTGVSLGSETVQTFERNRNSLEYMYAMLNSSYWSESTDSTLYIGQYTNVSSDSKNRYTSEFSGFSLGGTLAVNGGKYIEILENEEKSDYVFNYNIRECYYLGYFGGSYSGYYSRYRTSVVGRGTIRLENPTSPSLSKLILTGDIEKTLTWN